jgi:hypothetical protein
MAMVRRIVPAFVVHRCHPIRIHHVVLVLVLVLLVVVVGRISPSAISWQAPKKEESKIQGKTERKR